MPRICYIEKNFRPDKMRLIEKVNEIIDTYTAQGYSLTLRQLYYQLVARDIIPNNQRSYKNIGVLINDARLAGLIDWRGIEDRTRNLKELSHWKSPEDVIRSAEYSYHIDWWEGQENYCEVWVEKEALADVVGKACYKWDVPYFSCRGYVSQSEMWGASQRLRVRCNKGNKRVHIIHLGDHDPSGIDMSRDIQERLELFGSPVYFHRIALNMDQIDEFNPPPNPAKVTDSRAKGYIERYGDSSWELDALEPKVIDELISDTVLDLLDMDLFNKRVAEEKESKNILTKIADNYEDVSRYIDINF